ncbi:MAG: hypothetical protein Kow0077_00970 [Anaerolineae bacterium]
MAWKRLGLSGVLWLAGLLIFTALACNMQPQSAPIPTATPQPVWCLPHADALPVPARPVDPASYQTVILDFLNQGGSPKDLLDMLRTWGVVDDDIGGHVDATHDLNRDYFIDVIVTLHSPLTAVTPQPPGQLLIFGCSGADQRYRLLYGFASAAESSQGMPHFTYTIEDALGFRTTSNAIQDITADGLPELIFWVEQCTTLACFREPVIITWSPASGGFVRLSDPFEVMYTYVDALGRPVRGLPNAGVKLLYIGKNQPYNLVFTEGETADQGPVRREYGPFRPSEHVWAWNGDRYTYLAVNPQPSPYLIHTLRDADRLLAIGDLDDAIALYSTARTDPDLQTWGGVVQTEENHTSERERLTAYAAYRLVLAYAALGDGEANATLQQMQRERPWEQTDVASYYTLLASTFYNEFLSGGQSFDLAFALRQACQRVQSVAQQPPLPLTYEYLGDTAYFGLLLGDYTLTDLCPFE